MRLGGSLMKILVALLAFIIFLVPQASASAGNAAGIGCSADRLSALQVDAARMALANANGDIQGAIAFYRRYRPVVERYCGFIVLRDGQLFVYAGDSVNGGLGGAPGDNGAGGGVGGGGGVNIGDIATTVGNVVVGGSMITAGGVLMTAGAIIGLGIPNPNGINLFTTGYGLVLGGIVVAAGPAGFNGGGSGGACQCGDAGNSQK